MKKITSILSGLLIPLAALVTGCHTPMEEITEISFDRVLTPLRFTAEVVASKGTDVTFSWQVMNGADAYILEVYQLPDDAETIDMETAEPVRKETVLPDQIPFTVEDLTVDKTFTARVQGISESNLASKWATLHATFATKAVRNSLNPVVKTREATSVTITWDKAADSKDLSTVQIVPVLPKEGEEPVKVEVTDTELSACEKTLTDLEAGREYRFTLFFGKAGERGSVVAFTRPNIDGSATEVASAAEVVAATDMAAGAVILKVPYSEAALDIVSAYPNEKSKFVSVKNDLSIYGVPTDDGKKPVLSGFSIQAEAGATKIHLEDLVIDGAMVGSLITNGSAALTALEIVNCEVYDYEKGIITVASSASGASYETFLVDGCYMHDINASGTAGGDFFDVRAGDNGALIVKNSTFYAVARTFFRFTDNAKAESVSMTNCTLNYVTTTTGSGNNAGIFNVRTTTNCKTLVCQNNVFLNMVSDNETDKSGWVRMARSNASQNYAPDCGGNVYFNMGPVWWESNAVGAPSNANAGATYTTYISTVDAEGKRTLNEEGGLLLEADPCINSAAGKMYLSGEGGAAIVAAKAGDPRWWDAVMPEVIRETELTVVSEDYTWDFTEKTIYDTEELTATTIIGNARIFATASAPAQVVMSQGVTLPAVVMNGNVPTCGGVEVLTRGYGSVKVKAESASGIGTLEVLAGGDRYPVLADGKEHTVVLGDLTGENSIYVIADGQVTLKSITWTTNLTPDVTTITLATPSVSADPASLEEGTEQAVTFSWDAVENAADYQVTWQGSTSVQEETTLTVDAATVAALKPGDYTIEVVARPVATSTKYVASKAGDAKLTVKKVQTGNEPVTITWNYSDYVTELGKAGAINTEIKPWTFSVGDPALTWYAPEKSKYNKTGSDVYYIQAGATAKLSEGGVPANDFLKFTAPANGKLVVTASGTNTTERSVYVMSGGVAEKAKTPCTSTTMTDYEFEVKAGDVYIYGGDGALRYYKVTFTYVPAPPAHYVWDYTDYVTELGKAGAINTEIKPWTFSVGDPALTWYSPEKSKYNKTGSDVYYIQAGATAKLSGTVPGNDFLKFTAPADGKLVVTASGTNTTERSVYVMSGGVAEKAKTPCTSTTMTDYEFEVKAGDVYIYGGDGALRYYKVEYTGK